ncbi:TPA: hypothetical protein N0F65_008293 [Lagenidium giganteum]|uniref:ZZ-type domain-containing protein n=1 Tax=Lagenidium giganteum TaxID=4803 RepID=A0AAV2YEN1_9STRA|nr:TPA: hypothetical protein N0F65_008293 [Lagenidium giganteum]
MAAVTNVQHNIAAIQLQLQALQLENSTLTKDLCLKENYLQLKEQQLRVMQRRMEELEHAVATWKDKYLQHINQHQQQQQQNGMLAAADAGDGHPALPQQIWVPWAADMEHKTAEVGPVAQLVDKLSAVEREKLKKILNIHGKMEAQKQGGGADPGCWEESFDDVSSDLKKVLLCYLLPVLFDRKEDKSEGSYIFECLGRTYSKQALDVKIVCRPTEVAQPPVLACITGSPPPPRPVVTAMEAPPSQGSQPIKRTSFTNPASAETMVAMAGSSTGEEVHLFDCVDCDSSKKIAIPHGPRELHPTKAVYISKPLVSPPPAATRRYSFAPNKLSSSASSNSLQATLAESTKSSTGASPGTVSATNVMDYDGDRRSGSGMSNLSAQQRSDGKIKKIMGSMMGNMKDRLNRHKPQLTANASSMDDDESVCDGCGRGPIVGCKWVCRTCRVVEQEYELCEKCYGQGMHGKENEDALFERIEEIVVAKCPKLAHEQDLMKLLRVGICKANLKKFSFCLTWIADLLQCKQTKDLRARALEISQITPQVRSEFVRLLTDLLQNYRKDIDLITEWEPAQPIAAAAVAQAMNVDDPNSPSGSGSSMLQLDTLRIWVKDVNEGFPPGQQAQQT